MTSTRVFHWIRLGAYEKGIGEALLKLERVKNRQFVYMVANNVYLM